jgi:hypothetical protein
MRQDWRRLLVSALIALSAILPAAVAQRIETNSTLSWRQTDTSLSLMNGNQMVWQHVHDRQVGKPFMRFGLIDGTELTRPWPYAKEYPKNDHQWHRALWWSWKAIDGVNYWEQHQEGTDPVDVQIEAAADFSAKIILTIHYHQPDQAPLVKEVRTISISPPDANGSYQIDWVATFFAVAGKAVEFGQNSYGGLALRFSADCCGDSESNRPAWVFRDDQGRENGTNNQQARWVAYSGQTPNGKMACVAIFDHPGNPGHPAFWQTRSQYPYLNPSLTCKEAYELKADQPLRLRYRILVKDGEPIWPKMENAWKAYANGTPIP